MSQPGLPGSSGSLQNLIFDVEPCVSHCFCVYRCVYCNNPAMWFCIHSVPLVGIICHSSCVQPSSVSSFHCFVCTLQLSQLTLSCDPHGCCCSSSGWSWTEETAEALQKHPETQPQGRPSSCSLATEDLRVQWELQSHPEPEWAVKGMGSCFHKEGSSYEFGSLTWEGSSPRQHHVTCMQPRKVRQVSEWN